ncbi:MAG: ABC transporter ATP-binding protein/permease [Planctomycetes bacterium]|nr:ABC transporter ATP-binding protein/permease [Planctomycetota bacterium]
MTAWRKPTVEPEDHLDEIPVPKSFDGSLFKRLIAEARPHARLFVGAYAVLLGLFLLELAGPWILRGAIDGPVTQALALRERHADAFESKGFVRELWIWASLYVGCALATLIFRYLEVAHITRTGQAVIADLRARLFRHIQSLDLAWFDKRPTGQLVTRVTSDVENLSEMVTTGLCTLAFDVVKVVVAVAILFFLHWKLALLVSISLPVLIGVSLFFRGGARDAHRLVRARLARTNGYLQEVLSGIRVVQVFRREERVSGRFASLLARYLEANMRTIFLFALALPALDFVVNAIQGATVWTGGIEILGQRMSYGLFLQFWFYVKLLTNPLQELGERYNVLQSAFASAERVFGVIDTKPTLLPSAPNVARANAAPPEPFRGHVRFENVSFSYVEGVEVLSDVTFEIPPGATVAVVGATGAGKSTLVNLLLRFYEPTSGRITVDGIDLREWDLGVLRRRFGLVLQEDFLFAGTVRENLVMGRDEIDDEVLAEALEASRAERVVASLSGGLDSPVAERGATLSTGERQLLAIARALAGRPELVILDEATASVDSTTEARIEEAQQSLLSERSALVIAHRLSTVRRADQILVMHRGRIRERGRHQELLRQRGIYARLHTLQFAEA